MNKSKWFIHPIMILIISVVAVFSSFILYIYWYVEVSLGLQAAIEKTGFSHNLVFTPQTWIVILILSILVGMILVGISVIFTYNQKTLLLYRLQRNFINNFTHELRTPVASLKLYLDTFRKHELSRQDQLKYLSYMIQDSDRLSNNINRILSLAKIENRILKGDFVQRDIVSFIVQFVDKNRHLYQGCDIDIHHASSQRFDCNIDVSLFEMMLMNLLNNAIKYNQSKTPLVEISFAAKGRKLHISFKDNGIGLPPKEAKKIFRKFYQIGQADDLSTRGTGLGLYLVDSIVRLHKGKVTADSPGTGQGSVFTVMLPLATPPAKAAPQTPPTTREDPR